MQNQFMTNPQMGLGMNGPMFAGVQNQFMTNPASMGMMMPVIMPTSGGISYQNPHHNNLSASGLNVFNNSNLPNKGPSQESWYKDGIDMGKKIGMQPKNQNDNIKEF